MRVVWLLVLGLIFTVIHGQESVIDLYPEGIPCENDLTMEIWEVGHTGRRISKVHHPVLAVYPAEASASAGSAVVICPGGGYTVLAWDWEGTRMAKWFNTMGVTAFVVKYRLPHWESESCKDKVALMDAQRAMRTVRAKADAYGIDPNQIGIMGFSAGGHLASTLSTHFDYGDSTATLAVERYSCRPDFSILMYPVVTLDTPNVHTGSRRNLVGENPDQSQLEYFSNEKQVTSETPPTLLIHADDDRGVVPENSVLYYLALRNHGVPAALHIYESGGHGFSFAQGKGGVSGWPEVCKNWLADQGLLSRKLKALIVDGQNNHKNWPETTPILRNHLELSGRFEVDVATTPSAGESMLSFQPEFQHYDVIISNYNGDPWPQETKQAFEEYVRTGGGFVSVHAADNAFPDWEAYNEMIGLGGWAGRDEQSGPYVYYTDEGEMVRDTSAGPGGHHGKQHEFVIRTRDSLHPIMQNLPQEWMHVKDELYDQLRGPAHNMQVLATAYSDPETGGTGRHEPMLMANHYGLGRVFHTTLGHLNESQMCVGFITTFLRGAEWAATGEVSLPVPGDFPGPEEIRLRE